MAVTVINAGGGGGGGNTKLTVTLQASDQGSLVGQNVFINEYNTDLQVATFEYDGQPHTVEVPAGFVYRIIADEKMGYVVPEQKTGVCMDDTAVTIIYQKCTRLGFKRKKAESSPSDRIEYMYEAIGKTPVTMGLTATSCTPNYGDWGDFINDVACPVMLGFDGKEKYELDRNNQTLKANGEASDISNSSFDGNAMVRFSGKWKWVYRYEDDTYEYVIFADGQYDENYRAYAHTNMSGEVQDCFYYAMYKGSFYNPNMRSLADQAIMVSTTRNQEVDRAVANGKGWDTIYKSGWEYIADLLTLISKSDNSQGVFGAGFSIGNSAQLKTGTTKTYGGFWGSTNGKLDVKVFWVEGFWGNIWEGMRGLMITNNTVKVKMTPPYNFDATGYIDTKKTCSGTSGGYTNLASVTNDYGFVPYTVSGSETTYYCDGLWYAAGPTYALVGGPWRGAGRCGSRCVSLDLAVSSADTNIGSRLSFIP